MLTPKSSELNMGVRGEHLVIRMSFLLIYKRSQIVS